MGDLVNKNEVQEGIESAKKTYAMLTSLKNKEDNELDKIANDIINEANKQDRELQEALDKNFGTDFLQTSKEAESSIKKELDSSSKALGGVEIKDSNDLSFCDSFFETIKQNELYLINPSKKDISSDDKSLIQTDKSNKIEEELNYFGKKRIELDSIPQNKESFIKEFNHYCQKGMNVDEMKILCAMLNMKSPPSKLNKEHKDILRNALNLVQSNPNYEFLPNAYKSIIKVSLNKSIGTESTKAFLEFVGNKSNKLDSMIKNDCKESIASKILNLNPILPTKTLQSLKEIINPMKYGLNHDMSKSMKL